MTRAEAIEILKQLRQDYEQFYEEDNSKVSQAYDMAIDSLETDEAYQLEYEQPEFCADCISRESVKYYIQAHIHEIISESGTDKNAHTNAILRALLNGVATMPSVYPQEPKTGHCKDCKWWRDSDGEYRRGARAESMCPINTKTVFLGEGYCYRFDPQKNEDKE